MKKLNYLFAGLAAVALATSCSNDEPNGGGNTPLKPQGDIAYMNIVIKAANQGRSTTDGSYKPSDTNAAEHTVNDAKFYFFDEAGVKANIEAEWTNPTVTPDGADRPNVEYIGENAVLVLEGLEGNDYPKYMLTVLNLGSDWQCPNTLKEAAEQLQEAASVKPDQFVMTTSSYFTNDETPEVKNHQDYDNALKMATYYATVLEPNNFYTTKKAALENDNPVAVYVERLAAKVQVKVSAKELEGHPGYYELEQTLGGGENEGPEALASKLYLKINGWNLTATAKESYLCKILQEGWKNDAKLNAWSWNNPGNRRSFFAQAATWGSDATDGINSRLNYITNPHIDDLKVGDVDDSEHVAYCYENTNLAANLYATNGEGQNSPKLFNTTYITLDTEIGQFNEKGEFEALDLVKFRGVVYTKEAYMAYILNKVKAAGNLNYHYEKKIETKDEEGNVTSTTTKNTQIDTDVLKWVEKENGAYSEISIEFDEAAITGDLYKRLDENVYEKYEDQAAAKADLAKAIADQQDSTHPAIAHKGGRTLYNIAIEHLGAQSGATAADLGYYGVVRNHWYVIDINKFSKVGTGIFDPDNEEITVLPPTDPEPPLYYVGATVNILSWKIVNQSTEL